MDFFTSLHKKSDKNRSYVNNLNIHNAIEAMIFSFNCYQIENLGFTD